MRGYRCGQLRNGKTSNSSLVRFIHRLLTFCEFAVPLHCIHAYPAQTHACSLNTGASLTLMNVVCCYSTQTQARAKVTRQLWDLSNVLSNPCFRGWHNEHKHQADADGGK